MESELEDFLLERHELDDCTKTHYRRAFKALAKYTNHPFSLTRAEMNAALAKMEKDYKDSSWNSFVVDYRCWYKWKNGGEYPECVRHLKLKKIRREDYIRKKILTDAEAKAMIRAPDHPRDRAYIAVLRATGARKGEMLGIRIRDLMSMPYGYNLVVSGKTGMHSTPPILGDFAKVLRTWLECHPARDNPDAPLWATKTSNGIEPIKSSMAHYIVKNAAAKAGLKRNVHTHMFRHTQCSWEGKRPIGDAASKKLHGWSKESRMPSVYQHLDDQDAVEAHLRLHGIAKPTEEEDHFKPVTCAYCGAESPSDSSFCHGCGVPLKGEVAEQMAKRLEIMNRMVELLQSDPELREFVRKKAGKKEG